MIRYFSPIIVGLVGLLARPAFALNTALVMGSDPGDFIGQGQNYYFTPANGTFTASRNFDNGVSAYFSNGSHDFTLNFAAPNNAPLAIRVYNNATSSRWKRGLTAGEPVAGPPLGQRFTRSPDPTGPRVSWLETRSLNRKKK